MLGKHNSSPYASLRNRVDHAPRPKNNVDNLQVLPMVLLVHADATFKGRREIHALTEGVRYTHICGIHILVS